MFSLKLLGGAALEAESGAVPARATQRHRLALLALLASAGGTGMSRDKLTAYLWPEADAERGRHLLSNSIYVLRQALGDDALVGAADTVRLDADRLRCDARDFEKAVAAGELAQAAALYGGPFLDGFFLSDAPELERWIERERSRLAGLYTRTLETLAEAAERAGDAEGAAGWWKTRAAHDPLDSRAAMRLMRALEAAGNRAGALQHAGVHQRMLQEELGIAAAPEIVALVERLRREPAAPAPAPPRPAAPPDEPTPVAPPVVPPRMQPVVVEPTPASIPPAAVPASEPRRRARWPMAAALVVLLALAAVAWRERGANPPASAAEPSIVVLPFVNMSADGSNEFFSDGLTEEVIARLAAVSGLKVISRTSAMHYKGSQAPLMQIGRELGVTHVLEGSVRESDGKLRITAQLVDARTDAHRWAETYDVDRSDPFGVQERIARDVVRTLEVKLARSERRLLGRRGTTDPVAYELYRRGRFYWHGGDFEQSVKHFERAIARDSTYADPWAGLADAYLVAYQYQISPLTDDESQSRQKWAAERALALDDQSADAHTSFAVSLWWQRNWPGAERELRRALELNPGDSRTRGWYSNLLSGMGRMDEAVSQARTSVELDPFGARFHASWPCYVARDYRCAEERFRRSLELGSTALGHAFLGLTLARQGRLEEALREVNTAHELANAPVKTTFLLDVAVVRALAGDTAEARRLVRQARTAGAPPFASAIAFAALGERDSAFVMLEATDWRWPHRACRCDPGLDPLRDDPRFARLSERVEREMGMR